MIAPVFPLLSGAAAVTSLIGSSPVRAYGFGDAPMEPTYPYVTWQLVAGTPAAELSNAPTVDAHRVQVDCWGATQASVLAVAEAVRDALEAGADMVFFGNGLRDPETQAYRYTMDFQFWKNR